MAKTTRVRFAPSPSGHLHVGGARTALFNWLVARRARAVFVLRIEDTDEKRSTPESIQAILSSLRWLELDWDEGPEVGGDFGPYFQSQRQARYRERAIALLEARRAYRCFCSAEQLRERREHAMAAGTHPGYDGRCGRLDPNESHGRALAGEPFAVRFRVPSGTTAWTDGVRGRVEFQNANLDDFVILRSDGRAAYNFAVVVDDADMQITDVIRGEDHISNTPKQVMLFEAFELHPPDYAHVPLILGPDGARLSKRHGATSIEAFRAMDILPDAMVNHLALLGWSLDSETTFMNRRELIQSFSVERINKSAAIFDEQKLIALNALHLRALRPDERRRLVLNYLERRGLWRWGDDAERLQWLDRVIAAVGDRLKTAADIEAYAGFLFTDELEYEPAALAKVLKTTHLDTLLHAAREQLTKVDPFEPDLLEPELRELASELGVGAGKLFTALRVAVTGRSAAPGIFDCLALCGRPAALARIDRLIEVAEHEVVKRGSS